MPVLNSRGEWCSGIAGAGVYWQGGPIWTVPGEAGGAVWLSDDEVIGQRSVQGVARLSAHHVRARFDRDLLIRPLNAIIASGTGQWAVIVAGFGIVDSWDREFAGAACAGMGPDGSYARRPNVNALGWDVLQPDGATWTLTGGDASDIVNYGGQRLTWRDGAGAWRAVGLPEPKLLTSGATYQFRYVWAYGGLWQLYQTDFGPTWLHPRGDSRGYEVAFGNAYRIDTRVLPDGRLRLVYATQEGEVPSYPPRRQDDGALVWGEVVVRDLDLSQPPVELKRPTGPVPPPPEPPPMALELDIVTRIRAQYPTPLGAQHGRCLLAIATALGNNAGLLRKDAGTYVVLPNGAKVSQDIICYPNGHHFDCLADAESTASPIWIDKGFTDPARYYRVSGAPPPPPPDVPAPPPDLDALVNARIATAVAPLVARIAALEEQGSTPAFPARIALRSAHGKYVAAEPDGRVVADRDGLGSWETFDVEQP